MPHPSDAHVDAALSTFVAGYDNGDYFADVVAPVIETGRSSGKFHKYLREDIARQPDLVMAATGHAAEQDYQVETGSFATIDYAAKGYVSLKELADTDEPMRPIEKRAAILQNDILLAREIRVANLLHTTGSWATANTSAAANPWTDATNGDPLGDIDTMLAAIAPGRSNETRRVMILGLEAWQALRKHPDVLGAGAARAVLTRDEASDLLGIDEILVSDAQKNTAHRGATASYSRVWDATNALIVRVPVGDVTDEAALACATFRHNVDGLSVRVRRWQDPGRGMGGSEVVQVEHSDDEVMVQNDMGYLLTGVTS